MKKNLFLFSILLLMLFLFVGCTSVDDPDLFTHITIGQEYSESVSWLKANHLEYTESISPEGYVHDKEIQIEQDGINYRFLYYVSPVDLPNKQVYRLGFIDYTKPSSASEIKDAISGFSQPSWYDDENLPYYEKKEDGVYQTLCVLSDKSIRKCLSIFPLDAIPLYPYADLNGGAFNRALPLELKLKNEGASAVIYDYYSLDDLQQSIASLGDDFNKAVLIANEKWITSDNFICETDDGQFYYFVDSKTGRIEIRLKNLEFEINGTQILNYDDMVSLLGYPHDLSYSKSNGYKAIYDGSASEYSYYKLTIFLNTDLKPIQMELEIS